LAIVPVVILNKLSQKYVPEADEEKGSFELLAEIIIQVIVLFLGILLIHRIITYVPTYSGVKYPDFSVITIVLAVLVITLSLQTKLGEKVSILVDRVSELWNGTSSEKEEKGQKGQKKKTSSGNVRVSQPIAGQAPPPVLMTPNAAISQSLYTDSTPIHQLPTSQMTSQVTSNYTENFDNFNNQPSAYAQEPMAANEGGGAFGSAFGGGF
jgi:hypothetical protein